MGVRAGAYPGGWCTWYAWYRAPALTGLGNAWQWAANARARGLPVSSVPQVGATAVFQPGVQGAGGGGHVAHVEAVLGGGWLLVSEMNFAWNGGGFGLVDYRYVHTGPGVLFIL
jgi:surface antigen